MNRIHLYKTLMLMALLFVATVGKAQVTNIDYENWMGNLPDDMRLTQLSIPLAHDAATHASSLMWIKDQELTEREAFKAGVRAFDLRIHGGYSMFSLLGDTVKIDPALSDSIIIDSIIGCMMHGDVNCEFTMLNNFYEEIHYCLPEPESLGNECMFLFITREGNWHYENNYAARRNIQMATFRNFLGRLVKRYGKDRFVAYSDTITLGSLRGKIMVFTEMDMFVPHSTCDVPVNFYPHSDTKEYYRNDGDDHDDFKFVKCPIIVNRYDEKTQSVVSSDPVGTCFYHEFKQLQYDDDIISCFKAEMDDYTSRIDEENTQNLINYTWLNGYGTKGGLSAAAEEAFFGTLKPKFRSTLV